MARAVVIPMKNHTKAHARRRRPVARAATGRVPAPKAPSPERARMSKKKLIEESKRWLGIINAHKLNEYKRRKVVSETLDNFRYYYNRGYLEYRKSVTEGGEFAAIEWSGKGSYFEDVTGRRYIDCLGGYGIYSAGINHPKIVRAVKSQLERMPLSSQELLDPLRPPPASRAGSGDLQEASSSRTAPTPSKAPWCWRLHPKSGFISCVRGFLASLARFARARRSTACPSSRSCRTFFVPSATRTRSKRSSKPSRSACRSQSG
jgi:hypothetical protein